MPEINDLAPAKITKTTPFTFELDLDSSKFGEYKINGVCENVKVPSTMKFHDWATSVADPVASSADGMLPVPDLAKFGRSEQLHCCLRYIIDTLVETGKWTDGSSVDACSQKIAEKYTKGGCFDGLEVDKEVVKNAISWA
jgi:hypothetical protein